MAKNGINEAFKKVKNALSGLKALSAVEVESGLSEGQLLVDSSFDLEAASAYNAEVLKAKIKAKNAMGMTKETVEMIIIELSSQIHIIQPTPNEKYLVYMAADRSTTNVGMARKVMKDVAKELQVLLN